MTILSNLQVALDLPTPINAETLAPGSVAGTWTSLNPPIPGSERVYSNGLRQKPGVDYTLAGNVFTSAFWAAQGGSLLCDYLVLSDTVG